MEQQNKFKNIVIDNGEGIWGDNDQWIDQVNIEITSKQCTILCLEEQIKLRKSIESDLLTYLMEGNFGVQGYDLKNKFKKQNHKDLNKLHQQLKLLKDGN